MRGRITGTEAKRAFPASGLQGGFPSEEKRAGGRWSGPEFQLPPREWKRKVLQVDSGASLGADWQPTEAGPWLTCGPFPTLGLEILPVFSVAKPRRISLSSFLECGKPEKHNRVPFLLNIQSNNIHINNTYNDNNRPPANLGNDPSPLSCTGVRAGQLRGKGTNTPYLEESSLTAPPTPTAGRSTCPLGPARSVLEVGQDWGLSALQSHGRGNERCVSEGTGNSKLNGSGKCNRKRGGEGRGGS